MPNLRKRKLEVEEEEEFIKKKRKKYQIKRRKSKLQGAVSKNVQEVQSNKSNSEIFVLSPNVLQKLGINLLNIGNGQYLNKSIEADVSIPVTESNAEMVNDSEILNTAVEHEEKTISKTAHLMTTSVLLSPTFISSDLNITGELNTSSVYNTYNSFSVSDYCYQKENTLPQFEYPHKVDKLTVDNTTQIIYSDNNRNAATDIKLLSGCKAQNHVLNNLPGFDLLDYNKEKVNVNAVENSVHKSQSDILCDNRAGETMENYTNIQMPATNTLNFIETCSVSSQNLTDNRMSGVNELLLNNTTHKFVDGLKETVITEIKLPNNKHDETIVRVCDSLCSVEEKPNIKNTTSVGYQCKDMSFKNVTPKTTEQNNKTLNLLSQISTQNVSLMDFSTIEFRSSKGDDSKVDETQENQINELHLLSKSEVNPISRDLQLFISNLENSQLKNIDIEENLIISNVLEFSEDEVKDYELKKDFSSNFLTGSATQIDEPNQLENISMTITGGTQNLQKVSLTEGKKCVYFSEDTFDEAYASDLSNSNLDNTEISPAIDNSNEKDIGYNNEKTDKFRFKVHIQSQKKIEPEQFFKLMKQSFNGPPRLVPISKNTSITKSVNNGFVHNTNVSKETQLDNQGIDINKSLLVNNDHNEYCKHEDQKNDIYTLVGNNFEKNVIENDLFLTERQKNLPGNSCDHYRVNSQEKTTSIDDIIDLVENDMDHYNLTSYNKFMFASNELQGGSPMKTLHKISENDCENFNNEKCEVSNNTNSGEKHKAEVICQNEISDCKAIPLLKSPNLTENVLVLKKCLNNAAVDATVVECTHIKQVSDMLNSEDKQIEYAKNSYNFTEMENQVYSNGKAPQKDKIMGEMKCEIQDLVVQTKKGCISDCAHRDCEKVNKSDSINIPNFFENLVTCRNEINYSIDESVHLPINSQTATEAVSLCSQVNRGNEISNALKEIKKQKDISQCIEQNFLVESVQNNCTDKENNSSKMSIIDNYLHCYVKNINNNNKNLKTRTRVHSLEDTSSSEEIDIRVLDAKVLKTYLKCSKKNLDDFLKTESSKKIHNNKFGENEINLSIGNHETTIKEFCICSDFGRLDFHDQSNIYEHIHFMEIKKSKSDLLDIFSIYSEYKQNFEVMEPTESCNYDNEYIESEAGMNICWTSIFCSDREHGAQNFQTIRQNEEILRTEESVTSPVLLPKDDNPTAKIDKLCKVKQIHEKSTTVENESLVKTAMCNFCNMQMPEETYAKHHVAHNQERFRYEGNTAAKQEITKQHKSMRTESGENESNQVVCGICDLQFTCDEWLDHIQTEHSYIAWEKGEKPIIVENERTLRSHLTIMLNFFGELVCSRCNLKYNTVTKYMKHYVQCKSYETYILPKRNESKGHIQKDTSNVKTMHGNKEQSTASGIKQDVLDTNELHENTVGDDERMEIAKGELAKMTNSAVKPTYENTELSITQHSLETSKLDQSVKHEVNTKEFSNCGVCNLDVENERWLDHIQKEHNYLAWKDGEKPVNMDDKEAVHLHLLSISKANNGLKCSKCFVEKKRPKTFLEHVKKCFENEHAETTNSEINITHGGNSMLNNTQDSLEMSNFDESMEDDLNTKEFSKCGVCNLDVENERWLDHIQKEHNYLAWKDGEKPVNMDDKEAVHLHLLSISKANNGLKCSKCFVEKKRPKTFLEHVKKCFENEHADTTNSEINITQGGNSMLNNTQDSLENSNFDVSMGDDFNTKDFSKCGVCNLDVENERWLDHIQKEHSYLAWKDGEKPVNMDDKEAVHLHLLSISKANNGLKCSKCFVEKKRPKTFLEHVKKCFENEHAETTNSEINITHGGNSMLNNTQDSLEMSKFDESMEDDLNTKEFSKCGVCNLDVENERWLDHIQKEHNYLAWKDGEKPVNMDDKEAVHLHLLSISKANNGLKCSKCFVEKKRPKTFLEHVKKCFENEHAETTNSEINITHGGNSMLNNTQDSLEMSKFDESMEDDLNTKEFSKCGVCNLDVENERWLDHIQKEHNYLAWKDGEKPVNMDDKEAVHLHLLSISKANNGLKCSKCFVEKKRPKTFLEHVKKCFENEPAETTNSEINITHAGNSMLNNTQDSLEMSNFDVSMGDDLNTKEFSKCGVCNLDVENERWLDHIQKEHNYLAWKDGEKPVNMDDKEAVHLHLLSISKANNGLKCSKCFVEKKRPKTFLEHVKKCFENEVSTTEIGKDDNKVKCAVCGETVVEDTWIDHSRNKHNYLAWRKGEKSLNLNRHLSIVWHLRAVCEKYGKLDCSKCDMVTDDPKAFLEHLKHCNVKKLKTDSEGLVKCAVCCADMPAKQWKHHAKSEHYNIAWREGETPIDLKNPYVVIKYLKEYVSHGQKLICKVCRLHRTSHLGFYAHILTCGKTPEEIAPYQMMCTICNKNFLCIYQNQHMTAHRAAEINSQLKQKVAEKETKKEEVLNTSVRRKAAVKAQNVIENYSTRAEAAYSCQKCGFETDRKKKMSRHVCGANVESSDSDPGAEMQEETPESGESDASDVDSDLSEREENETQKKKKKKHKKHVISIGHVPEKDRIEFMAECAKSFVESYFTNEALYPEWRHCAYQAVPESDVPMFTPPLEISCKIKDDEWTTVNRFEAKKLTSGIDCVFTGGYIRTVAWVPLRVGTTDKTNYLSIITHLLDDVPQCEIQETVEGRCLLQIWDFGDFNTLPKYVMGIALDIGIVWAMSWCPSGARDVLPDTVEGPLRLGLLAVASSSGSAYIFAVPHPQTVVGSDSLMYRLKPVAELRTTSDISQRKPEQATSICWSMQKEHAVVIVGYANGYVCYFNLNITVPLWKIEEDGVTIYSCYKENHVHFNCVLGIGMYPGEPDEYGPMYVISSSWTGVDCSVTNDIQEMNVQYGICSNGLVMTPHRPAAIVTTDLSTMKQCDMEVDLMEALRVPVTVAQRGADCFRCGVVALFTPPTLYTVCTHPALIEPYTKTVARVELVPLDKQSKMKNDELSMKRDPFTYSEVVKRYGISISLTNEGSEEWLSYPARFPLEEVTSMAFCKSWEYHDKLAIATHSGVLFLIDVNQ